MQVLWYFNWGQETFSFHWKTKRKMKEGTAGTDDCHKARGIVELFSVSPSIRGHCDRDVGDIMSACQRAQRNKPIRSQWVNTELTAEVALSTCPLQHTSTHSILMLAWMFIFRVSLWTEVCPSSWSGKSITQQSKVLFCKRERGNAGEMPKAPCSSISEAVEGVESSGGARCNLFLHGMMFCPEWLEFWCFLRY